MISKFITFDGIMAAGKSLYASKLCSHFGIDYVDSPFYNRTLNFLKSIEYFHHDRFTFMLPWLTSVLYAQEKLWKDEDVLIVKDFWNFLISGIMEGLSDNLINAFYTLVTRDEELVPICSFYLNVSDSESSTRVEKRSLEMGKFLIEKTYNSDEDLMKNRLKAVDLLADRYPFFHVINTMRPPDEVFDEIVHITEEVLSI